MSPAKPKAFVLCGDGINCENETVYGLELAGFTASKLHTSELLSAPEKLRDVQMLAMPGGFSFGDEIASGKVLALKLKDKLSGALHDFLDKKHQVIGICNGFQCLVQLGLLPDSSKDAKRVVSLCHNKSGKFMDKWVELDVSADHKAVFFKGLNRIALPIRHGEGNLQLAEGRDAQLESSVRKAAPLRYAEDVNGSFDRIAALTNHQGNCLGLMPHPEAFVRWSQHPDWTSLRHRQPERLNGTPDGLAILQNAASAFS